MKNRKNAGLAVLIAIIICAILCGVASVILAMRSTGTEKSSLNIAKAKSPKEGYIAALYIDGVIQQENNLYNQKWLLATIKELKKDTKNKAIAISINSPGGNVYEGDEIYLALQDYKTTGRPIYTYQRNLAASGAYYISCASDKIYANRNTLTGSIGVITGASLDLTDFLAKYGIKSTTIHAGKNKNMMNYNEPLTQEQIDIMQSIADECYDQFTGIVAMCRNIPINDVKKLADGRIYTANQALKNGLIDSVDNWENMIKNLQDEKLEGKALKVIDYKYKHDTTLREYLLGTVVGKNELSSFSNFVSKFQVQYPAFLYE